MTIKVGFVGLSAAGWARVLEPALRSLGDTYQIVAVSTTNEASARASAQRLSEETKHPVKSYYGDTTQIANDPDVDFVVVAVKAPEHRKALLPVIQAKKPFFIEWPAGRNVQETRELAALARQNGVRSIIGLQGRHSPVLNKVSSFATLGVSQLAKMRHVQAKELIASGKMGKMLSCSVIATTHQELLAWGPLVKRSVVYTSDSSSGGSLIDIGLGHHLDTLLHVLGSELTSVSATTKIMYPTVTLTEDDGTPTGETASATAPDHVALNGTLANGALVSVSLRGGYKSTPGRHQLIWVIDGDSGSIRVEGVGPGSAFIQVRPPKLYLDAEEVEVESDNYLQRILAAQFAEFAKGPEQGKYATLDDAEKLRGWLDTIGKGGKAVSD